MSGRERKRLYAFGGLLALAVIAALLSSPYAYAAMTAGRAQIAKLMDGYRRPADIPAPPDNPITPAKIALGKALFFDPRLSGSGVMSCASCHNPSLGWQDGMAKGVGDHGARLARRTPTILNLAWSAPLFWDGRSATLEDQAKVPMSSGSEMNMPHDQVVAQVKAIAGYRAAFAAAYPGQDFSKLEVGAVQLEARPFSVGDMVSEALSMVEPQATEKTLELKISGEDPGVVVGDKHRLRQVLLNFLSNAVKFTGRGAITVRFATEPRPEDRLWLKVEVIDLGVGIAPEKIPNLFRRFSQADGSITRNFGGSGLGLAISRELIELMGGSIGVESEAGRGSTFWFEVELARGTAAPRREKAAQGRASFPGRRILVVDDVALNRELFQEMLQQYACEVHLACDGQEAVEAVARERYDLVLMDVHMPLMDGLAATQAIRAAGHAQLPVLALTASGAPEQVDACFAAGMNGHLLKPLAPQDLERALARLFDGVTAAPVQAPSSERRAQEQQARETFESSFGPATTLRLVRMFHEQLAQRFLDDQRSTLQEDAHKVAGSAGTLGLLTLSEAAQRLEASCRDGRPFDTDLARMRAAAQEAGAILRAWTERLNGLVDA